MKDKYGDSLDVKILATDSEEAKAYNFRSATNVLVNGEFVPLDVATDVAKFDMFIAEKI